LFPPEGGLSRSANVVRPNGEPVAQQMVHNEL
jgi:hypothetical protein